MYPLVCSTKHNFMFYLSAMDGCEKGGGGGKKGLFLRRRGVSQEHGYGLLSRAMNESAPSRAPVMGSGNF